MIRGGRNNITSAPAFSKDAKKLLLCTANSVSVYSVATGLKITSLEGHTTPVTTVIVDLKSDDTFTYCWTSSLDGKIHLWEFSEPKLLKAFDTHLPIYSLVMIPSHVSCSLIAYVSVEDYSTVSKDLFAQIRRFILIEEPLPCGDILKEMEEPKPIVLSPSGELFGVCHNCNIHIWNASFGAPKHLMPKETTLRHTQLISVFAFHPNQKILAAGDVTGRVLIWKDIGNGELASVKSEDDPESSCTTFNWHSAEVTVLNFSSDGALLYSGVKEGDLVVWELDTGKKQLLPKIESPLLYFIFSSDPTLSSGIAALCTANHCVQLYNLLSDHEVSEMQVQVCERNHQPDNDGVRVRKFCFFYLT
ncbi:PREDICTED: WD repeat-containing protein 75-like isoform X1 [Camelina sativa]|uniref:WD repeat-containing protein 75-like isoform X1 n=1 Tax=Camelina sativa TaxID=90675 RepID=A0ABM1QNH5_CAMSA|nr:PREDICTED: WD repeat-containing protein 75-like isoform X1 [Camelina sativa]XP_019088313.1 PREDICTED: WD repeat-containing protein 75-like isoform X1 [Camelina sativa]